MNSFGRALLGGICTSFFASPAFAQVAVPDPSATPAPTANAQENSSEGDIVVTALRRSENLQSVPVSITALSGNAIAERRLSQISDLAGAVPNLQASPASGDDLPIFALRGISMSDYSFNQQSPVATYFDEVYKGSFPLLPLAMFDLERVEVLRGPQGTLYGKNTTGGAINFISRKPGYDSEAFLKLGYGNYNRFDVDGAVQTALGSKVAARVAFTFARADGWFKNRFPGGNDASAVRQYGVRASFLYEPSNKLDFVLRLSTSLQNPVEYGVYARPGPAGIGGGVYELFGGSSYFRTGLGRRELESNYAERHKHRTSGVALTGNWKLSDSLTVTSVTSYDYGNVFVPEDTDGSPLKVVELNVGARARQFAQDLRLASNFTGSLNFILGGYYNVERLKGGTDLRYYNDIDVDGNGVIDANDCAQDFFISCNYRNQYEQTKRSAAIYGDANFKVSDRVTLRGGLRYTRDHGKIEDYTAEVLGADGSLIAQTIPPTAARFRGGIVTGKAGIDYKTANNNLLYASYSRGYRASAFNAQAYFSPDEVNSVKPETVNAYELGFKTQFFNRVVTFNGAVFYYDYQNQQALNIDSTTLSQTLLNIPKSRILGGELELTARPTSRVRLNAGLGLLSTKIQSGSLSGVSLEGNQLPNAPKVNLTAGIGWDVIDSKSGKLSLDLNGSYSSKKYFELFNIDRLAQSGYVLVNGQINFRSADLRYGIGIWGKNIFNRYYRRYAIDLSGFGFDYFHLGDPRTYGITADVKF